MKVTATPRSRRAGIGALHGALALAVLSAAPGVAQEGLTVGTIVVAHGGDRGWNAPVLEVASGVPVDGPVEVSFLMGAEAPAYRFQDAAVRLVEQGADRIVVVPLLVSSYGSHYSQIDYLTGGLEELDANLARLLERMGAERPGVEVPMELTAALDASPEIATILAERALRLAETPAEQALHIIGHGPNGAEDHAEWLRNLRPIGDSVAVLTGFRDVQIGLVRDDASSTVRAEAVRGIREVIELQHALTGRDVVVVPLLISRGRLSTQRLPVDLEGLAIAYDGDGLLPHPELSAWISRRVREAVDD